MVKSENRITLMLIWVSPSTNNVYFIGELQYPWGNGSYAFHHNQSEVIRAKRVGFDRFGTFNPKVGSYSRKDLFPAIKNRLPNKQRPDYGQILERYGLTRDSTDMEILQATGGRLATDNFAFVCGGSLNDKGV